MEITAINPTESTPGKLVTLTMEGMPDYADDSNTKVYLGGHLLMVDGVDPQAGTIIVGIGQDAKSGTFTVTIRGGRKKDGDHTVPTGYITAEGSQEFTVNQKQNAVVISFRTLTPSRASSGDLVTINGDNLDAGNTLRVGTRSANITTKSEKKIQFRVPNGLPAGTHRISLVDGNGDAHYCLRPFEVV
ncbi:IPT/TIG domain-containing protein [Elioraea rosea]|uniref:IPT/TIG domain-containing protein n=1 Tax=Elioraea rosea TaxID=2492390 RepID=UPI0011843FDC|nr:IPT/TIG domain-containing protein [Elioraea rosea]